jgi:anti-sigma factor RsiW
VNCPESSDLHPYFDDELDEPRRAAFAAHLAGCLKCSRELETQKALRLAFQEKSFRYTAPASLAQRVQSALRAHSRSGSPKNRMRSWLATAAALLVGVGLGAAGTLLVTAEKSQPSVDLPRDLVAAHVRSLMADHLEDVKSTDKHTVKPWFNGQVDFSPPVKDFTEQGYPLLGGRLDYLDDRPTAALVYGRAKHVINLFIWPAGGGADSPARALSRRGYNLLHWTTDGLDFWAVSDLNAEELGEFARLNRESPSTP